MYDAIDLMFIGEGNLTFLIGSLKNILDGKGLNTAECNIDIKTLKALTELPKLFVADAEVLLGNPESRMYLYDQCIEQNKKMVLIGDESSLKSLHDVTALNVIAQCFVRPINNSEIADKIYGIVKGIDEKGNKDSIMVVDDSPTFLRLISEWLDEDYNVNVCPSATAAFHMIEANRPDLILLDYEMPICNGGQFLQMLKSERMTADIPVVFLTSKDDVETVKTLLALKPQGYLLKTQTKENILKSISSLLVKEKIK
ncbi:MAG: response regulator [Pseudobutyrivibrio sp.]|nr:response regulator [Pseudobutyrivibrio sp.]